jgi:hypothetical protein
MIDAVQQARLTSALWECDRHRAAVAAYRLEGQAGRGLNGQWPG